MWLWVALTLQNAEVITTNKLIVKPLIGEVLKTLQALFPNRWHDKKLLHTQNVWND
jgi:hypothetical protein